MLRFRCRTRPAEPWSATDLLALAQVIDDAMRPGNFLVALPLALSWMPARGETIAWEVFRGRLLDAAQTRLQRSFLSWHVLENDQSVLSVKFDVQALEIHVTRGFACHVWEGYDAGGGVIESRESVKWASELVGTIVLARFFDLDDVRDELICMLWQAVVGTSRLPLTSVEAPLPAFVLGQLHYMYDADSGEQAIGSWEDALQRGSQVSLCRRETVKLVEWVLRRVTTAELGTPQARGLACGLGMGDLPALLRSLFNDISLSPYTRFVDNALAWVDVLEQQHALTVAQHVDFLGHLLRQLGRHLTAYDLVTFHHRGANYPDALLLDAVLKAYLRKLDANPDLFTGDEPAVRRRRRALRQGCLLRRHYEGHLVPDAPTSPGENARVMPPAFPRIADDQFTQPHRRQRRLFATDPLTGLLSDSVRQVFAQSIDDLHDIAERMELGIGVFIDRPLGYGKAPAEPDQTPLLAHEAFSPSLARRRWQELRKLADELRTPCDGSFAELFAAGTWPDGLPCAALADCPRPVAALTDVRRVAADFVILRTLPGGLANFLMLFDGKLLRDRFRLRFLADAQWGWCAQVLNDDGRAVLALSDATRRRRLEMVIDFSQGVTTRAGIELPSAGLIVQTVFEDTDEPAALNRHDLSASPMVIGFSKR